MRHLFFLLALASLTIGCGESGNRVIDTSNRTERPPMTEAESDAAMYGGGAPPEDMKE